MDDISEQQDVANEIAEAISNPVNYPGQDIDEDDLLAELEELEQEELDQKLLDVGPAPAPSAHLPDAPTHELPAVSKKKVEDKDDDLAELEAWANAWYILHCYTYYIATPTQPTTDSKTMFYSSRDFYCALSLGSTGVIGTDLYAFLFVICPKTKQNKYTWRTQNYTMR